MPQAKGQIKALARSGKALMIDETWYSDRYGIKGVDRGDTVAFEYRVNGDFHNITSKIEKVAGAPGAAANSGGSGSGRGSVDINILASHSINCATELAIHDGNTDVANLEAWVKIIYQLNLSIREKIIAGELNERPKQEDKPMDEENPFQ